MIGRIIESQQMISLQVNEKADLLTVTGRRRVGKTYIIKEMYGPDIVFDFTGTYKGKTKNQLSKFTNKLNIYSNKLSIKKPKNWAEAFEFLEEYLTSLRKTKRRKVIFFDEFPWINTRKSGFLSEFTYWWNDWATNQNIIVVICGSATSWMVNKVINNKGGLHNRITMRIHLNPFTLKETKAFLDFKKIGYNYYQITQIYMAFGGIPHYLNEIKQGESVTQAINRICFTQNGLLRHEFDNLYAAIFTRPEKYIEIIRLLSNKKKGMSRQEIIQFGKINDGGGLTKVLEELEMCSFITSVDPFANIKKNTIYRLIDNFTLFYFKFIEGKRISKNDPWLKMAMGNEYKIWSGYAFENICNQHVNEIQKALGIWGILSMPSSYYHKGNEYYDGIQIDLLIDRKDQAINLCEIKFYNDEFVITKEYDKKLRNRRSTFIQLSKTKKQVFNTIITTYGVRDNMYRHSQVDQVITLDELF